MNDSNTTVPA